MNNASSQPWMNNKRWASNLIYSNAKYGTWVIWGFTLFWCAVSFTLLFSPSYWQELSDKPLAALALLFPLIGIALIVLSIRTTLAWRKFGPVPIALDPFPGGIGGHVGGYVDTSIPYQDNLNAKVSLRCLHSYMSGSGKNRRRRESIKWENDGICHLELGSKGTRLKFRFDVPENLPQSDVKKKSSYHLWRVNISVEMEGIDFDRTYEIPVFATAEKSRLIRHATESHAETISAAKAGVGSFAEITTTGNVVEAWFPPFKRAGMGVGLIVFGLVFAATGLFIGYQEDGPLIFPLFFIPIGGLLFFGGVWTLGKGLKVKVDHRGVSIRRSWFGWQVKTREISADDFSEFTIEKGGTTHSGNKQWVSYKIYTVITSGEKIPVGEKLIGRAEAEVLLEHYAEHGPTPALKW